MSRCSVLSLRRLATELSGASQEVLSRSELAQVGGGMPTNCFAPPTCTLVPFALSWHDTHTDKHTHPYMLTRIPCGLEHTIDTRNPHAIPHAQAFQRSGALGLANHLVAQALCRWTPKAEHSNLNSQSRAVPPEAAGGSGGGGQGRSAVAEGLSLLGGALNRAAAAAMAQPPETLPRERLRGEGIGMLCFVGRCARAICARLPLARCDPLRKAQLRILVSDCTHVPPIIYT